MRVTSKEIVYYTIENLTREEIKTIIQCLDLCDDDDLYEKLKEEYEASNID